jgi:glycerol-3-phosphate dehydrogenase (NAD(P)+)
MEIGIIGAGSWGSALSLVLSENSHNILIWAYEKEIAEEINFQRTNLNFLPNVTFPLNVMATNNLSELNNFDILIFSVPTQFIRPILTQKIFDFSKKFIINTAKGIEKNSLLRISEIFYNVAKLNLEQFIVLTGPSHAEEVAQRIPTSVVMASTSHNHEQDIQELCSNSYFRIYSSDDIIGCEMGGALKNIIAIAAGVCDGLGLGDNTKAALITRGLAEMSRLGVALGANPLTFSGLSGLGDLVATCNSRHSRNRYVGEEIGKGRSLIDIQANMQMIAEGVPTIESAYFLSKKHDVQMPITEQMYKILFEGVHPSYALQELMSRSSKREWWW